MIVLSEWGDLYFKKPKNAVGGHLAALGHLFVYDIPVLPAIIIWRKGEKRQWGLTSRDPGEETRQIEKNGPR